MIGNALDSLTRTDDIVCFYGMVPYDVKYNVELVPFTVYDLTNEQIFTTSLILKSIL